jgi:HSP20 family protein
MTFRVVNSKMNPIENPYTFRAHNRHNCHFNAAANILRTETGYEIQMALPGVAKSQVEMTVTENILHVHSKESEQAANDKKYIIKQFDNGYFSRKFRLDDNIDASNIDAVMENGVLRVMLNLKTADIKQAKSIEIK